MEIFGTIAGTLGIFAFTPQAYRTIRTKQTRDLSLVTYILLVLSSVCWIVYGLYRHSPSLYIANSVIGILAFVILSIKIREEILSDDAHQRNQQRSK
ncbi:MAG: SemiSWEET family transporter [Patescibacteria group bacterium]